MPEPSTNPEPVVYQLRVVLRCVSPLIWRRLLVRSDSTIADLHRTLQVALGWSDEHLHASSSTGGCTAPTASSIRAESVWVIWACVSESASCMSTTSSMAG